MQRIDFLENIENAFTANPVVALLGPRQCGKTTLAKQYAARQQKTLHYFDLEHPAHLAQLAEPMLALNDLEGFIVIDEIQLRPDLFPMLRVLVDEHKNRQFLILGSASRDLIQQSSETLAGRISYIECTPFNLKEVKKSKILLNRGGYPRSYLAENSAASYEWRQSYISTFLERDIPNLGFRVPAKTMRRFWMMLTHYHGQIFNASELGTSLGLAHTTVRHYVDILTGTFMVRELLPWFENIKKRQIKSPKIYFRDTGIYLALLNITSEADLHTNPRLGAAWEGFALEQIINSQKIPAEQCFFWGVHQQAEIDLLVFSNGKRLGFEFKYKDAPTLTKSMHIACETLKLDKLYVIYPGKAGYKLNETIEVMSLEQFVEG